MDAACEVAMDMVMRTQVIEDKTFGRLASQKAGVQLKRIGIK